MKGSLYGVRLKERDYISIWRQRSNMKASGEKGSSSRGLSMDLSTNLKGNLKMVWLMEWVPYSLKRISKHI